MLPSAEYVELIQETTLENQNLTLDNKNLIEEISQFKEYKAKLSKFGQEQKKYVKDLELSINTKQQKLNERKKSSDYLAIEDFSMEAEVNYEDGLLDQANMLQNGGPEVFKSTLKITYENFKLKGQVKAMEQHLHKARADADLVRSYDDDTIATGKEKLTEGELVIRNKNLSDKVQQIIRAPQ